MSKMKNVLLLTVGAAVGAWITWNRMREYYEEKTQQAVDSVKAAYAQRDELMHEETEAEADEVTEETSTDEEIDSPIEKKGEPYGISETEYGTRKGYTAIQLILFADGVLADEEGVTYSESDVGEDMLELLLDNDEDVIFVRNDELMRDFEVITDAREYGDVTFQSPFDPEDL